jgi:ribosomal peptide maturation radical SAM protein 1
MGLVGADGCAEVDVCLVSMPYASLSTPSVGLGLLKAALTDAGITTTVAYANLWFAENAGLARYELCASSAPTVFLMGEWTFAGAAFADDPRREAKDEQYLRQLTEADALHGIRRRSDPGVTLEQDMRALRKAAIAFIDEAARRVLATGARIVGCTSTFEQHVASLALLRRVRELDPDVITMLGGANCETVMGEATHRCFPWVDYVVSGEADGIIARVCRMALAQGRDIPSADVPAGVLAPCHRQDARRGHRAQRALFSGLDELPVPDYADYFLALTDSSLGASIRPGIPMESSRGCWWGAVHHCTFCGLNGTGMAFRPKSAGRVLAEMDELEARHGISDFAMVDNILDMKYYTSLLPELAKGNPRQLFYEIKANLTREHAVQLAQAGVRWVQPGIESLHTDVLALMDKGIKGWQNIQLLKWSCELGLRLSWAILWGFPGEKDEWYQDMASWIPALEHLQPPTGMSRLRYDRYSVYHEQAQQTGLVLFPIGAMSAVYPVGPADLDNLAYFFSVEPAAGPRQIVGGVVAEVTKNPGIEATWDAVTVWREAQSGGHQPELWRVDSDGVLAVTDTRSCSIQEYQELTGLERAVLLACDGAPRPSRLAQVVARDHGMTVTEDRVAGVIDRMVSARLVLPVDGRLVGLVLDGPPTPLPPLRNFPGGYVASTATVGAESR